MDPALTPPCASLRYALQQKPVESYPYYWMGRGGSKSQGVGWGGVSAWDSSWTHEERQSGDGPHSPAVGSAHHMVKQSEGHWPAAAASVLSTFIAVDV